jgi:hypothetical protein
MPPRASFVGLPVELRLRIYQYLLSVEFPQPPPLRHYGTDRACERKEAATTTSRAASDEIHLKILTTCRRIYEEAVDIVFKDKGLVLCLSSSNKSRFEITRQLPTQVQDKAKKATIVLRSSKLFDRLEVETGQEILILCFQNLATDYPTLEGIRFHIDSIKEPPYNHLIGMRHSSAWLLIQTSKLFLLSHIHAAAGHGTQLFTCVKVLRLSERSWSWS